MTCRFQDYGTQVTVKTCWIFVLYKKAFVFACITVCRFFRFLQEMLKNISKGLHARIELGKKTEEEQKLLVERQQMKIDFLTDECKQVFLSRKQ